MAAIVAEENPAQGTEAHPSASPYPIGEFYRVLDGFDIHKSSKVWEAVVVVEDQQRRRHIRLYKWTMKADKWKVDLARFSIGYWDLDAVTKRIRELKEKYNVT
jgi:hypothetical protein